MPLVFLGEWPYPDCRHRWAFYYYCKRQGDILVMNRRLRTMKVYANKEDSNEPTSP